MDFSPFPADAPRRLLVGFSGGRDSTALLHRLATVENGPWNGIRAIHIDHGLHAESAAWARHCEAQARTLGVTCAVHRVVVAAAGRGLEDAARRARYDAFDAERRKDECLVLAHHRDDQAETVLLALLRGSGERGLSAMRDFTLDARGPIWRPLLATPGTAIAAYAAKQGLSWIDDPSNRDERLSRNHLRQTVMPLLRRQWPQVEASLAESARRLAEADDLLRTQARGDLAMLLGLCDDVLDATALRAMPSARATRALRLWAEWNGTRMTSDAIERVLDGWSRQPDGRALHHPLGTTTLRQWGGRLWLTRREPPDTRGTSEGLHWDGRTALSLGMGADDTARGTLELLGAESFETPLRLVARRDAPARFRAADDRHTRPLQTHFAALGIPPWVRDNVPLLVDGQGELQAVADLAYGPSLDTWLRSRGARLLWQPGDAAG